MYTTKPHFHSGPGRIFLDLEYFALQFRSEYRLFPFDFAALESFFQEIRRKIWVKYSRFLDESEV